MNRPNGKWRVQVKYRSRDVADRTFDRRGDAVRWETEQKRLLHSGSSSPRLPVRSLCGRGPRSSARHARDSSRFGRGSRMRARCGSTCRWRSATGRSRRPPPWSSDSSWTWRCPDPCGRRLASEPRCERCSARPTNTSSAGVTSLNWCPCRTPTQGRGRSSRSTRSQFAALLDVVVTQRRLSPGGADITLGADGCGHRAGHQERPIRSCCKSQLPAVATMLREGGDRRLRGLPRGELAQGVEDHPVGAVEQRGQAPNRRCGHLP